MRPVEENDLFVTFLAASQFCTNIINLIIIFKF